MPGKQTRGDLLRIPGIWHDLTLFCVNSAGIDKIAPLRPCLALGDFPIKDVIDRLPSAGACL